MANEYNYTSDQVEELANKLCSDFNNPKYFRWYCSAIYEYGIPYIEQVHARVSDARYPGRLFSKLIQERRRKRNKGNAPKRSDEQKDHRA